MINFVLCFLVPVITCILALDNRIHTKRTVIISIAAIAISVIWWGKLFFSNTLTSKNDPVWLLAYFTTIAFCTILIFFKILIRRK